MEMGAGRSNGGSSSGEEDGDAEWRAAIQSVTSDAAKKHSMHSDSNGTGINGDGEVEENRNPQNLKHYQIKAQKLLHDILEKSVEMVTDTSHMLEKKPIVNNGGIRLFKHAAPGIVFDHADELEGPKTKPKILPGEVLDEKSKKFRKRLQLAAVDGADIISAAKAASQKSLLKRDAREEAAKAAAKREEERVAELKKIRGERWLPSLGMKRQKIGGGYK